MICQVDYYHFYSGRCGPAFEARRRGSDQRSGREGKAFPFLYPFISKILHPAKSPGRRCTECLFRQSKVQYHL